MIATAVWLGVKRRQRQEIVKQRKGMMQTLGMTTAKDTSTDLSVCSGFVRREEMEEWDDASGWTSRDTTASGTTGREAQNTELDM